ncbi:hypothetical protein [Atlantibacter sp.]|uniref:hypothetical protein n=1 Tax=Atlantibacter sp. TaxID=1903473 RepID=UPI0028AEF850|nr:hypothetical protein [Atlantibacter sp.]
MYSTDEYTFDYYITQKLMEVGPSVDEYVPDVYIGLAHRHNPKTDDSIAFEDQYTHPKPGETLSQTAVRVYNDGQRSVQYVYHHGDYPTNSECVAYIISPVYSGQRWGAVVKTPGGCLMVPPSSDWCKITTPELVLDHGTITLKNSEGSSATTQVGVQCTTATAVTFNLVTDDKYVYLDQGKSEITVNNQALKSKIDLPKGDSILPVKDLLTGITSEGFHTGSSVLVMMPY